MKNLFMCLLISVTSTVAFAQDKNADLTEKGIKLLYDNVKQVKVVGDKDVKLQELLQDAADYIGSMLGSAMTGGDDEDDNKLNDVNIKCEPLNDKVLARCSMGIDYKGGDFLEISYFVDLKNNQPVRIHQNHVRINRY